MTGSRETFARVVAVFCLGLALVAVVLYAVSGNPLLLGLSLGGGLATVAAALWYLLERGRRVTHLGASLSTFSQGSGREGEDYQVLVDRDGETIAATIRNEGALWRLEMPGQAIEYSTSAEPGSPVAADYELAEFQRQHLTPGGLRLRCCGTCSYFTYSSLSREMSGGWVAYCLSRASGPLLPEKDAVHLWHVCEDWEQGE